MDEKNLWIIKELTMLLIHLSAWEEKSRKEVGEVFFRAWRGFSFEVLNELEREGFIKNFSNSVIVTPRGRVEGRILNKIYNRVEIITKYRRQVSGQANNTLPSPLNRSKKRGTLEEVRKENEQRRIRRLILKQSPSDRFLKALQKRKGGRTGFGTGAG